ncbi:MAG TPA: hypothetical protein VGL75_07745 [Acidothermaceae bacterium]|jgi:hypothetical protein
MERGYNDAFESLRAVYLEDSWVLAIQPSSRSLAFDLDVVLTPSHPNYRGAMPGEQHDYRRARLVLTADSLEYEPSGVSPATDATGQHDFGHIDSWAVDESGWSSLEGDWGRARARNASVSLVLSTGGG